MEWSEALEYEQDVRRIAKRWAAKFDYSLYEDACQHTMMKLVEKVDLSKARSERKFIVGAINNILAKFFRPYMNDKRFASLDTMYSHGFQIDADGNPSWTRRGMGSIERLDDAELGEFNLD